MANITDFISKFGSSGVAKGNKYIVEFFMPRGINLAASSFFINTNSANTEIQSVQNRLNRNGAINAMAGTVTLPSRDLIAFELSQYGPTHMMPSTAAYMPVSISFYSNANMDTRTFFETWQTAVHNISSNTMNFYNEYVSDLNIKVLDSEEKVAYTVTLYEAWPLSIAPVDLSYSNRDMALMLNVNFRFRYWQSGNDDTNISRVV